MRSFALLLSVIVVLNLLATWACRSSSVSWFEVLGGQHPPFCPLTAGWGPRGPAPPLPSPAQQGRVPPLSHCQSLGPAGSPPGWMIQHCGLDLAHGPELESPMSRKPVLFPGLARSKLPIDRNQLGFIRFSLHLAAEPRGWGSRVHVGSARSWCF